MTEQVIKSVSQIKQINNLQNIIWVTQKHLKFSFRHSGGVSPVPQTRKLFRTSLVSCDFETNIANNLYYVQSQISYLKKCIQHLIIR